MTGLLSRGRASVFIGILICGVGATGAWGQSASTPLTTPKLFKTLPSICPTPDGLAMDAAGNIIFACPNYGDMTQPAVFMKIAPDNTLSLFAKCPVLAKTGRACPMGVDFGPDGGLYVSDNQPWPGTEAGKDEGRILKLNFKDGNLVSHEVVAHGMSHPNGIKYHDGYLYVTQSMLPKFKTKQLTSAVYRFKASERDVRVNNDATDKNLLVTFKTLNMDCQYGLDGLVFDSKGNFFVGNFGDGTLHKITFDKDGNIASNTLFAKGDNMRTTDGICIDKADNIYVADFSENRICKVSPDGKIVVVAQSADCDGSKGGLDQPGEPIVRGNELIVSNFDMVTGPDKVNTGHDAPYTLSVIDMNAIK